MISEEIPRYSLDTDSTKSLKEFPDQIFLALSWSWINFLPPTRRDFLMLQRKCPHKRLFLPKYFSQHLLYDYCPLTYDCLTTKNFPRFVELCLVARKKGDAFLCALLPQGPIVRKLLGIEP